MSKRKKSNPNSKLLATLLVLGVAVVGLLAVYVKFAPADRIPDDERRQAQNVGEDRDQTPTQATKTYYIFDADSNWQKVAVDVPNGQEPVAGTVGAYVTKVYPSSSVKLLSAEVKDKTAILNFSKGFASEAGSMEEGQLIEGLMRVLGQFPDIDKAQIMVDGETLETGHNVYDEVDVIRG
jgi:hypothetical protein